ncbi:MAG: phenylacetate-CoA oxygenase subunit PaaI [Ignavibacteria bacterium]
MSAAFPQDALQTLLLALADDELMLGHRNAEWTGHAPVLEEDIAFSNIAQDELGHSLLWYTLYQQLTGKEPDAMAFERAWHDFTCCRFVTYPKGDFAYTVVRQYLFDEAEQVRLRAFAHSTYLPIKEAAAKILREEAYHILHSKGLVERLGDATDESHRRMQAAVDVAFPQALGMFEEVEGEQELIAAGVFPGHATLQAEWMRHVVPVLTGATLAVPVKDRAGVYSVQTTPDNGGRRRDHNAHLQQLVDDLQAVYRIAPGARW